MTTPKSSNKNTYSSNPTNRYLSDKELGKPSQEIGQGISRAPKINIDQLYNNRSKTEYFKLTSNKDRTDTTLHISQKIIK